MSQLRCNGTDGGNDDNNNSSNNSRKSHRGNINRCIEAYLHTHRDNWPVVSGCGGPSNLLLQL